MILLIFGGREKQLLKGINNSQKREREPEDKAERRASIEGRRLSWQWDGTKIIIIIICRAGRDPMDLLKSSPYKEGPGGIELTTSGSASRRLNHGALQPFFCNITNLH